MSDTPRTDFASTLQIQSMQYQITELHDMLRNTNSELAAVTEERRKLAGIILRIGWPARGSVDEFASVFDFAAEIQAAWKYEDMIALSAMKGGHP